MDSSEIKPLLAITLGDPAGVGPEAIVGAWPDSRLHDWSRLVVIGHPTFLERAAKLLNVPGRVRRIQDVSAAGSSSPDEIPCLWPYGDAALAAPPGEVDPRSGQAAYDAITLAAELALSGAVDGIVTAPLHKAALWKAGHHYPGHTELLAERCGVKDFAMMLYLGPDDIIRGPAGLGVAHTTLHMALREVFRHLTSDEIVAKAHLADGVMRSMRQMYGGETVSPRIGIAALNPHAGEDGLFGDEEKTIIRPAVERARQEGLTVRGPVSVDTLFARARDGEFDAVVAMYHDQGHIALKLLGMHRAVNVTLGLPIVRTSVAHGTAFDLAWQGRAQTSSMIEAIRVAVGLVASRRSVDELRK